MPAGQTASDRETIRLYLLYSRRILFAHYPSTTSANGSCHSVWQTRSIERQEWGLRWWLQAPSHLVATTQREDQPTVAACSPTKKKPIATIDLRFSGLFPFLLSAPHAGGPMSPRHPTLECYVGFSCPLPHWESPSEVYIKGLFLLIRIKVELVLVC
jgi:hypothetical protein